MAWRVMMRWFRHEKHDAMQRNPNLSHDQAGLVALLALVALGIQSLSHVAYLAKASSLTQAELRTYHPMVPWFSLIAQVLLVYTSYQKGVRYFLVYAISGLSIATNLVWLGLFHGILQPSDLDFLNHGPDWWTGRWGA